MASDRTANIRLEVKSSGFKSGMKSAEAVAESFGTKVRAAFKNAWKNFDAVTSAANAGRSAFRTLTSVLGGVSLGGLARGAVESQQQFQKLGFAIQAATGQKADIGAMRSELNKMALDTGQSTADLANNFQSLLTKTGDLAFTKSALKDIATASTASGASMESLVDIVDGVNQQFGVTREQVPEVLAQMLSLSNKSGVSLEDFAAKFELVSAAANKAGLQGTEGLSQTAAVMKFANDAMGGMKKGVAAATGLFDLLGNKQERSMALMKLGVSPASVKGGPLETVKAMIAATKGDKGKLEMAVGAEQAKLLVEMGKDYAKAFDSTQGDVKTKTKAGLEALDGAMRQAARSTMTAADVQASAAAAMQTPQAGINKAMEMLQQAFEKPEMLEAIGALAAALPELAQAVSAVIDYMLQGIGKGKKGAMKEEITAYAGAYSYAHKQALEQGKTEEEAVAIGKAEGERAKAMSLDYQQRTANREAAEAAPELAGAVRSAFAPGGKTGLDKIREQIATRAAPAGAPGGAGAPGAPGAPGGAVDSRAVGQAAGAAAGRAAAEAVAGKPMTVKVTIEDKTKGGVQPGYAFKG